MDRQLFGLAGGRRVVCGDLDQEPAASPDRAESADAAYGSQQHARCGNFALRSVHAVLRDRITVAAGRDCGRSRDGKETHIGFRFEKPYTMTIWEYSTDREPRSESSLCQQSHQFTTWF